MSAAPLHVLLHGVPTHSALWNGVRENLHTDHIFAPDLPGYGSAPALKHPGIETHAGWLAESINAVDPSGLRPVHLVGQD